MSQDIRIPISARRRRAFGLISHLTPIGVPIFIALFYAPFIGAMLQKQGWGRGGALAVGLLLPLMWIVVFARLASIVPARFAKLGEALECMGSGLPLLGALTLFVWSVAATLWRLAH